MQDGASPKIGCCADSVRKNGSREEEMMCRGMERLQMRELGKDSRDLNSKILTLSDYLVFHQTLIVSV